MNTRDLDVFLHIYETQNVSRGAKDVFLTPQAASKILHKLEAELKVTLFTRSYFGVVPTPQGDALYKRAHQLKWLLEEITGDCNLASESKYVLNIASTQGIKEYLGLDFLQHLRATMPNVQVSISESPDSIARERLKNNASELGILGGPVDLSIYRAEPFTRHRPCLVIPTSNPLALKSSIAYSDLNHVPLALVSREFASYHLLINSFLNNNVNVNIVAEATELDYCHRLAAEGNAVAVSFDFAAWNHQYSKTVIRPFEDQSLVWETYLVYKVGTTPTKAASDFCAIAKTWLDEYRQSLFAWPK
ncbi:MAG: LysR family transcriptional regulator [Coriobacteriales bacterium]|nr:LysR family transcriptional regulator [Coriobacteriales bacterium]